MEKNNKIYIKVIIIISVFMLFSMILGIKNISRAESSDTELQSLSIEPKGTGLEQDKDNKNIYRVKVENNITSVKVNAKPTNSSSKISIEGNNDLTVGTNKVIVTVTAKNGESSKYIIYVRRLSTSIAQENVIPNVQEENNEQENNTNNEKENTTVENVTKENTVQENTVNETTDVNNNIENTSENLMDANTKNEENTLKKHNIVFAGIIGIVIIIIIFIIFKANSKKGKH